MRLSYHVKKFNQNIGEKENNCISKWKKELYVFGQGIWKPLSHFPLHTCKPVYFQIPEISSFISPC